MKNVKVLASEANLCELILNDVLQSERVLSHWEIVSQCIPTKYQSYSMELLEHITDLWMKIRGHSFASEFTTKFIRKYKKGTRKSLKQKS